MEGVVPWPSPSSQAALAQPVAVASGEGHGARRWVSGTRSVPIGALLGGPRPVIDAGVARTAGTGRRLDTSLAPQCPPEARARWVRPAGANSTPASARGEVW